MYENDEKEIEIIEELADRYYSGLDSHLSLAH